MLRARIRRPSWPVLVGLTVVLLFGGPLLSHSHAGDPLRHDDCGACQWWMLAASALLALGVTVIAPPRTAGAATAFHPRSCARVPAPSLPSRAPPV